MTTAVSAFERLRDYEQRSLQHQPGRPELVEAPGHWRGVGFRIGRLRLVAAFEEVVEILSLPAITPIPGAQAWMLGLINVRGNLMAVVDLRQFLGGDRSVVHEGQRVLVVKQPGGPVAIVVDELFGQRSFNDTHIAEVPDVAAEGERYPHFITRAYQAGDLTWGVFNMALLTRTPEFRQAAA
jgi:twitching motility protein PilI